MNDMHLLRVCVSVLLFLFAVRWGSEYPTIIDDNHCLAFFRPERRHVCWVKKQKIDERPPRRETIPFWTHFLTFVGTPLLLFHNSEVRIVPEFAPMLIQAAKQRMSQGQKYGWSLAGLFCHDDQYNLFPLILNNPNKPRLSWGSTYIWDYLGVFNIRGMGLVEEPE